MWETARSLGVGTPLCLWTVAPETLGKLVLDCAKRYAGELKQSVGGMSHSKALEAVANSCQFPNWHALQKVAAQLASDFDPELHWPRPEGGEERVVALQGTFAMLAFARNECPPEQAQQRGMEMFAERLSRAAGIDLARARDVVARVNQAPDWLTLVSRSPTDSPKPLYSFVVRGHDKSQQGVFEWSDACSKLVEIQDQLFQDYRHRNREQQRNCERQIVDTLVRRPDFLEGLLARATILNFGEYDDRRRAGAVYKEGIEKAESLMPVEFDGEVSWHQVENRFYHRLLYGYMEWNCYFGSLQRALQLARRQLRRNPSDNLGIRFWLPMLLCANRQYVTAAKAVAKIENTDYIDGQTSLVQSVCHLLNGQHAEALRAFLRGLFAWPELRFVIEADPDSFGNSEFTRTVIPDTESVWNQYANVCARIPYMEVWFSSVLNVREVGLAEESLANLFKKHWRQPDGDVMKWAEACKETADKLTATLADHVPPFVAPVPKR
jgi:hypothetical protein